MTTPDQTPCPGVACSRWGDRVTALIDGSGLSDTAAAAAVGISRPRLNGHAADCERFAVALARARCKRDGGDPGVRNARAAANFLSELEGGATVLDAAHSVGIGRVTVYRWRDRSAAFAGAWRSALRRGAAKRRAARSSYPAAPR